MHLRCKLGIGISYKFDALFKNNKKLRKAKIATRRAEEDFALANENLSNEIHAAYVQLDEAQERLNTKEKSVQLAHENYEVIHNRYINGLSLVTDMLDASNIQLSSELELSNARMDILYQYFLLKKQSVIYKTFHTTMSTSKNIRRNKIISNIILLVVIITGICWVCSRFIHLGQVEYTDNAQVKLKPGKLPGIRRMKGIMKSEVKH